MHIANAQGPTKAQQMAALERDDGQPIYMLNLLKFRDKAVYADGRETTLTGQQAYALYGRAMSKLVAAATEAATTARARARPSTRRA